MNRDFKGVWFPKTLWLDKTLSTSQKVVLMEIDSLDSDENGCYASIQHFADLLGKSYGTAANIISDLTADGWIVAKGKGMAVSVKFHEIVKKEVVVIHEIVTKVSRNREPYKESNTGNNTTTLLQGLTPVATPNEKVNWNNPKSDLQAFMGEYIRRCMPAVYSAADKKQVGGFFRQYGKMFSSMLATAGSVECAKMALDEAIRYFGSKGYQWGLKALSTNWGEFVNQATDKLKRG